MGICGKSIICLEASQAFFLYQSKLFSFAAENCDQMFKKPKHLFWWEAADVQKKLSGYDFVIANHMLVEMNPHALRIMLRKLTDMWDIESNSHGMLIAESLGGTLLRTEQDCIKNFYEFGFRAFKIANSVYIFVYGGKSTDDEIFINSISSAYIKLFQSNLILPNEVESLVKHKFPDSIPDENFWNFIRVNH
jgi:hypothetical protein